MKKDLSDILTYEEISLLFIVYNKVKLYMNSQNDFSISAWMYIKNNDTYGDIKISIQENL